MNSKQSKPSRLSNTAQLRDLVNPAVKGPAKFIWPVFIEESTNNVTPIASMPGQSRYSPDEVCSAIEQVLKQGVRSFLLFPIPAKKAPQSVNSIGTGKFFTDAISTIKKTFPETVIFTDVCLCSWLEHGHCGILNEQGAIMQTETLNALSRAAVSYAEAGADAVAPSAMTDGQVAAIRKALDEHNLLNTVIMSYSAKFASALYGPFRDAAESAPAFGDRTAYQLAPKNRDQAVARSLREDNEGADILMVKPALFYLDVIRALKEKTLKPVAAYNVSGEYSMIHATSDRGWGSLEQLARESITSIFRAGADIIISYWANQYSNIMGCVK